MKDKTTTVFGTTALPLGGSVTGGNALTAMSLDERLAAAIDLMNCLSELQRENADLPSRIGTILAACPALSELDVGRYPELLRTMKRQTPPQSNNVFAAFLLFYILSRGAYPQDCWTAAAEDAGNTVLGQIRGQVSVFSSALSKAGADEAAEAVKGVEREYRRGVERTDLEGLVSGEAHVGLVKIYEMLWEVFVTKYEGYSIPVWSNVLLEYRDKAFVIREGCEYREQRGNVEIYAVSYEGKLSKPMHFHCEDCCLVEVFDKNTWLAVSADGVGSCENSYYGSEFAVKALKDAIGKYLRRNQIIRRRRTRDEQGNKQRLKPIPDEVWANLMYYLRFDLAKALYSAWASAVRASDVFKSDPNATLEQFSTTLQFAFGCKAFVACGRVGDGLFFVRKRERRVRNRNDGCLFLNDGISGVTQTEVRTVAHLGNAPSSLLVDFYRPEEVTDIVITSDGAEGAVGDTGTAANAFVRRMRALPFERRCEALSALARDCSDYNETNHGSGDDSTIVHIVLKESKGEK